MSRAAASSRPSSLAIAALGLVGDGVDAGELVERFAAEGAQVETERARTLLDDLAALGLVRVASSHRGVPRFVTTSLGQSMSGSSLDGGTDLADRLAELERLRTDLLSTIAHEVRTPLTAIRTSASLLLDPAAAPSDEQRRTMLETIQRNADRIQRLAGDVLDLARFRAGAIQLQARRFDAVELARSVALSVSPLAEAAGQRIVVDAHGPIGVFGDHRRLEQALLNLVSNAQRFNPPAGTVTVRVRADREEVTWQVEDEGPGIRAADLPRLFERFFVGRGDRSARGSGVGLGLPTALAIAQAHGGRIDVGRGDGSGAVFALVVPQAGPPGADE
jgi:two-component system sensor histidine kinase BaeS